MVQRALYEVYCCYLLFVAGRTRVQGEHALLDLDGEHERHIGENAEPRQVAHRLRVSPHEPLLQKRGQERAHLLARGRTIKTKTEQDKIEASIEPKKSKGHEEGRGWCRSINYATHDAVSAGPRVWGG